MLGSSRLPADARVLRHGLGAQMWPTRCVAVAVAARARWGGQGRSGFALVGSTHGGAQEMATGAGVISVGGAPTTLLPRRDVELRGAEQDHPNTCEPARQNCVWSEGPRHPSPSRRPDRRARRDVCLSCVWDSTAVPPGRTLRARELYGTRLYYGDIGARFAYGIYVCFLAGYRCGRTRAPAAAGVLGNEGELSEARQRLQHQRHAPPSADLQMPSCARHSAPSGGRLQHV